MKHIYLSICFLLLFAVPAQSGDIALIRDTLMQAWKTKHYNQLKASNGFWGEAECMEILLDAYETTGKEEYKTMFEEVYSHFVSGSGGWNTTNGKDWSWNEFNDDIAWGVLASIRAYFLFGNNTARNLNYLSIAKTNYDKMYSRALFKVDDLYYLLRWKQSAATSSNSCVQGPATIAACYLAQATGNETYYEKAKMLYANQRVHLYSATTGRVYDTFGNNWASTYNQGTYLGAALMLYNRYGDEIYKEDAEMIMTFTRNNLCNASGIVNVCGDESADLPIFKGILMRYVRRFVADLGKPEYAEWLQKNAIQAYDNRNSEGICWTAWWKKTEEKTYSFQGTMTAVSAAMNAPLDINTVAGKEAFAGIQAGNFDYIAKIHSQNSTDDNETEIIDIQDNAYLGYNFVDCGNSFASGVELQVANDATARTVEIRLGSATGTLLASASIPASGNSWETVQATFPQQITGKNHIYLVFKGTQNALRFKSFRLLKGETNYSSLSDTDITDDGGTLASERVGQENGGALENLTDNTAETGYRVEGQSSFWIQYKARSRYRLTSYSITSGDGESGKDPQSWTLYGSTNGTSWTLLDTRQNQLFDRRNATLQYTCPSKQGFHYYKLQIHSNAGNADTQIAEWQLSGERYYDSYPHDFTKSGGELSASATSAGLPALTDNDPGTACTISAATLPVWIQYRSPAPLQILGYSLTSNGEDRRYDPKSWKLQASTDGQTWRDIDSRSNITFDAGYLSRKYDLTNGTLYSYFRLQITAALSDEVRIAEWQIHGRYIDRNDITALPGGTLTVQWPGKNEANAPENLTDKNKDGKYYNVGRKFFWAVFQTDEPVKLTAYSLMSANDWPTRDPKAWTLYGSNNNTTWTAIDRRENQTFLYRQTTLYYPVSTDSEYCYFKLDIEENAGEKEVQLAEWQLFSHVEQGAGMYRTEENTWNIYPNPAAEFTVVDVPEASVVSIKNLNGLTVYREKVQAGKQPIHLQACQPGVYIVTAESKEGVKTRLLIKK
jgi:predicted alpha-1,6-mannanase (GH76 family)